MPWLNEGVPAYLTLSPRGKQVWAKALNGLGEVWTWELVDAHWIKRDLKVDPHQFPILLDDGLWLVRHKGGWAYLKDGVYTAVPNLASVDSGGSILRDGTVVMLYNGDLVLGAGEGMRREWVRITS